MSDLKQAAQQALEALQISQDYVQASANAKLAAGWGEQLDRAEKAITALRTALEQQRAEPVAWISVAEALNGVWRRRQLDERFQFGGLDTDFQKWSVLAFRALDDAGRVLMTIEPESTTEGERLDQLQETIRELLTQALVLNGVCTRRQLDERFQFGKLDTDALNVQLGQQQAEPVQERSNGMPTSKVERNLRRMLCVERHGGAAYLDDGEASYCGDAYYRSIDYMRESIGSIMRAWYDAGVKKLAGAQPEQQAEPVATMKMLHTYGDTTPPQRKPLTDEQILDLIKNCPKENHEVAGWIVRQRLIWCRAIEAAHGIKEGT